MRPEDDTTVRGSARREETSPDAPERLRCRDVDAFLLDYVEARLDARVAAVFERHLALCEHCRHFLASYRRTIALGRMLCDDDGEPAGDAVPDELVQAILAARRGVAR